MKILLDTNILVYAFDPADLTRQQQAFHILEYLHLGGNGCLSAQCLSEFFSAATRPKRGNPPRLTPTEAIRVVSQLAAQFETYPLTATIIMEAGRGVCDHRLAYYDAQIWATARLNQTPVIFSEDFQHGQSLEGVRFINPFQSDFNLDAWA